MFPLFVVAVAAATTAQRAHYDATGEVHKTASEEFVEAFAGGTFADKVSRQTAAATSLAASVADQIAIRQTETKTQSHTAGFEVSAHYH